MDQIEIKAYAKVNLGLDVTGVREDGYHLVNMVMQTVNLCDDIIVTRRSNATGSAAKISISCDRQEIPADERNLAYRAADLLCRKYGLNAGIHVDIRKKIPSEAGMAGGSSDAAAVILALNELFDLKMDPEQMDAAGVMIGADVPFCLRKGTYLAEGIGEKLTKLPDMMHCHLALIKPPVSVSTPWAYKELDRIQQEGKKILHPDIDGLINALEAEDLKSAAQAMGNILEAPVIRKYPEIGRIKRELLENGAMTALMSGSGSVVFGVFEDQESAQAALENIRGEMYGKFKIEL